MFQDKIHKVFSNKSLNDYQILKAAEKWYGSRAEVADVLGVSERSVDRWMRQGRYRQGRLLAKRSNQQRIRDLYNSREIRTMMRAQRRSTRLSRQGGRLTMSGRLGPKLAGPNGKTMDYTRNRSIELRLSPDGVDRIREAWESGDPDHVQAVAREVLEDEYGVAGWNWEDGEDLDFTLK